MLLKSLLFLDGYFESRVDELDDKYSAVQFIIMCSVEISELYEAF